MLALQPSAGDVGVKNMASSYKVLKVWGNLGKVTQYHLFRIYSSCIIEVRLPGLKNSNPRDLPLDYRLLTSFILKVKYSLNYQVDNFTQILYSHLPA